jgi:hypothetical protein
MFYFKTITSQNKLFLSLFFFCTFAGIKKQKTSASLVFQKYRLKTIYSGTNFSIFLDLRVILSITAQSIFAVEPRWKESFRENITKINKNSNNNNFFLRGVTENGITQKTYF